MDHLKLVEAIAKPEVLEVTEKISEEIILGIEICSI